MPEGRRQRGEHQSPGQKGLKAAISPQPEVARAAGAQGWWTDRQTDETREPCELEGPAEQERGEAVGLMVNTVSSLLAPSVPIQVASLRLGAAVQGTHLIYNASNVDFFLNLVIV